MHRTALTRSQRRTRRTDSSRPLRARALENRLSGHRTTGRRTHRPCWRSCLCYRSSRTRWRRFVHRTWPGLRNNHSRRRRLRRCRSRWRRRTRNRRCRRRRGCGRGGNRRRCWRRRHYHCDRWRRRWTRCGGRGRRRNHNSGLFNKRGRNHRPGRRRWCDRRRHWSRWSRCRRCRLCRRRHNHGLSCDRWRSRTNRRRRGCLLFLRNRLQHISRPRDVRQIDLGLDFFFAAQRARGPRRRRLPFGRAADVGPDFFRFVLLQ